PQLPAHRTEDARTTRVAVVPDEHGRVLVEADVRAVGAPALLLGAHDDRLDDLALLHRCAGHRVLHRGHDHVADARIPPARATEHPDAEDLLRTRVVGDLEPRLLLDHV